MRYPSSTSIHAFFTKLSQVKSSTNGTVNRQDIINGYVANQLTVFTYHGPHRFLRAAGASSSGRSASHYGDWWVDQSVFLKIAGKMEQWDGWLTETDIRQLTQENYRAITAICRDWNDFREMVVLDLPAGEQLEGLVGFVQAQPEYSAKSPNHDVNRYFAGGAEQVFLGWKNPFWIRSIALW